MLRNRVAPVEVIPSWAALGNQGGQVRTIGNTILFSATDLMRFVGCAHATALDLAYMRGEPLTPREDTEDAALLQKQGDAHEADPSEKLKDAGTGCVDRKSVGEGTGVSVRVDFCGGRIIKKKINTNDIICLAFS